MTTFVAAAMLAGPSAAQAGPPTISRFKLDNGIRVVVLHVKNSTHFAAFSYLPLGLASDGAGALAGKMGTGARPPLGKSILRAA